MSDYNAHWEEKFQAGSGVATRQKTLSDLLVGIFQPILESK